MDKWIRSFTTFVILDCGRMSNYLWQMGVSMNFSMRTETFQIDPASS